MGRVIAVLDRNQAIYGFRGAHSESANEIQRRFNCRPMPLSISYRCPRAVVQKAKTWVPQIESHKAAVDGFVGEEGTDWKGQAAVAMGAPVECSSSEPPPDSGDFQIGDVVDGWRYCGPGSWRRFYPANANGISKWASLSDFASGDVILCRLTRPLVAAAFALIRARIPARVLGRDIGQGLAKLIERVLRKARLSPQDDLRVFAEDLDTYLLHEGQKLRHKSKLSDLGRLEDQVATIRAFIDGMEAESGRHHHVDSVDNVYRPDAQTLTVADLTSEIERLFSDNGRTGVTLSTIHKAKGLEWDRVFILDAGELMPWKWATQEWELAQERNLMYVGATRSKRELRYITSQELGIGDEF